jgi:tetratricopeptide (TPR) repeat protein
VATTSSQPEQLETHAQESPLNEPPLEPDASLDVGSGSPQLDHWLRPLLYVTCGSAALILGGLGIYALISTSRADQSREDKQIVASAKGSAPSKINVDDPNEEPEPDFKPEIDIPGPVVDNDSLPGIEPVEAEPLPAEPVVSNVPPRKPAEVSKTVQPRKSASGGGLSGVSKQYDDQHCQKLQLQFSWRVPAAAEFVEVNGERLPIVGFDNLRKVRAPYLFLPRGEHAIRLRTGEQPIRVTIADHLAPADSAMRSFFDVDGNVHRQDLLARSARAMDVHGAPFLLNMTGAASIADGEWASAERKFRRSLVVNPFFAPAHLNLAVCLFKRNEVEAGIRELRLAEALNVGNVFGFAAAITRLRRQYIPPDAALEAIPLDVAQYVSSELLTVEDERLTALMTAMAKYAVREEDRGKILNNLAVHFSETGKAETALEHFRSALAALKLAGPDRFALAEKVLSHMESACRRSNFPEAEEYAFMRKSVLP